jgi:hypothetical protein
MIWHLHPFSRRMGNAVRRRGWKGTARLALRELASYFCLDRAFFRFDLTIRNAHHLSKPIPNIVFSDAGADDFSELLRFSVHFGERELLRRLTQRHRCIIARLRNRIVFYGWLALGVVDLPFLGRRMSLPDDTAYFYNIYVHEACRGQDLFQGFVSHVRDYCLGHRLPHGLTFVDTEIGLPIRAYVRLVGADKVSLLRYSKRLWRKAYSEQEIAFREAEDMSRSARAKMARTRHG